MSLYAILNGNSTIRSISEFDPNLKIKSGYYLPVIDINPWPSGTFCTFSYNISSTGITRTFTPDYATYKNQLFNQIDQKLSQQIQVALTGSYSLNRDDLSDRLLAQRDYLYAQLSGCSNSGLLSFVTGIQQFIPQTNFSGQSSILTNLLLTGQYNYQFTSGLKESLTQSGINLYNTITGLNIIFSTISSLTQSGISFVNKINSLSGLVTGISGFLQIGINLSSTASNLASTGQTLYNYIINESGLNTGINNNITQSGISLGNIIFNTGSNLYNLINNLSGQANANFANVVNLTQSGVILLNTITNTGQQNFNFYTGISGALGQTGTNLYILTTGLSGAINAQIVSSGQLLSALKITGSSIVNVGNLTGLGGTLIIFSGGFIFVSGASLGTGAGVSSINNLQNGISITGAGGVSLSTAGQVLTINDSKPQFSITFNAASVTWTNMPAAANYFNSSALYTSFADLTNYTGVQLIVSKLATAGAATGTLFLRYSANPAQTFANFLDLDTGPSRLGINVASVMINSGFFPLVAGAKSGVYIALCGSGGSAAVSPVFGMITANFK